MFLLSWQAHFTGEQKCQVRQKNLMTEAHGLKVVLHGFIVVVICVIHHSKTAPTQEDELPQSGENDMVLHTL